MTNAFDNRIIKVGLELEGGMQYFQDLSIVATGSKFTSSLDALCEVQIFNLTREQRNFILTQASYIRQPRPLPIRMSLDVGRESYGTFRLYDGYVYSALATQPPDIGILLSSLANNAQTSQFKGQTQSAKANFRTICQQVATENGKTLDFQATDKIIENWQSSSSLRDSIKSLHDLANVNVDADSDIMAVWDVGAPRKGEIRVINQTNGMVGIPEITEWGVRVKMMIDNSIKLGALVRVESDTNPAVNGEYTVSKIDFQIANRQQPFWYVLECYLFTNAKRT